MTRTANHLTNPEAMIRRRVQQAAEAFEEAKAKFAEAFAVNPKYALEWHAEDVARARRTTSGG